MDVHVASIFKRIIDLKNELNLNQKQFAELLGVTQPAVSKYLKNRIPPPLVLLKLAKEAKTSIEWILTGVNERSVLKVAEPVSNYTTTPELETKIFLLPISVRKRLEDLITEILKNLAPHSGPAAD